MLNVTEDAQVGLFFGMSLAPNSKLRLVLSVSALGVDARDDKVAGNSSPCFVHVQSTTQVPKSLIAESLRIVDSGVTDTLL